ncbi:hypothetical protein GQ44DRAFT_741938 [Phaeosphaeriaceae sp. PMI808]|nr:hypothetical protein GQ44DRAFT_741938 [Phaeosphaeriaceae sp. PMI808]
MQSSSKKRSISTCIPCYNRKQKCNRQYPCDRCTRRRRPSECVYASPPVLAFPIALPASIGASTNDRLLKPFGYSGDSNSNTMALLKMVLDFLIQYFVAELNWLKQIVHAPTFLMRYQQWWNLDRPLSIPDTEFAILILRICSYAAQFFPSHSHTIDSIDRLPLSGIRNACNEVANSLAHACVTLDWNGSLIRVQHLLFSAIKSSCEGRTDMFWEGIGAASQAAQKAGIHKDRSGPGNNNDELENEMRHRVFCSLYILDSHLARQLDRVPFLPNNIVADLLPCMHLAADENIDVDTDAPDPFTERLMQLQLGRFWRRHGSKRNLEYNPTQAQQIYEEYCSEYLLTLSPVFALKPETKWDMKNPRFPMQRQLLYICIFDSICWHFRPLLLLKPDQVASLPLYKQILLQSQKNILAIAALKELEAIHSLHSLFNGSHTRFAAIIFNTFEACVLLLSLCTHPGFPSEGQNDSLGHELGLEDGQLTRTRLIQATERGLKRLQMLTEINDMAASGAETLLQLFANVTKSIDSLESPMISETSNWDPLVPSALPDMIGLGVEPLSLVAPEAYSGLSFSSLEFVHGPNFD